MSKLEMIAAKLSGRRATYIRVFDTPEGKKVLEDLCRISGITRPQFSTDTNKAMIAQGQQRVVHHILRMVNSKPEDMIRMIEKETKNED